MTWIFLFLAALTIAADGYVWKKYLRSAPLSRTLKGLLALGIVLSDLLLPLSFAIFNLLPDNTTAVILTWGRINLLFLCTVLPRMVVYAGYLGRRRIWHRLGWGIAAVMIGIFLWGTFVCRFRLRVEEVTIESDRLPAGFDGLRIAFFSDLHIGAFAHPEREIARLVDTIQALRPDLILFGGDLVNIRYTELDPAASALLGKLHAPLGVYSVIGNHDTGVYIKDSLTLDRETNLRRLIRRQEEMGWRVLNDETIYLKRGGDSISFSGISFDAALRNFRHATDLPDIDLARVYESVPRKPYNLTLCHIPQLWRYVADAGYGDLTLAGHVHSMQMKLRFGRERGLSPARLLYEQWSGLYIREGRSLYINDGIGAVGIPARLGASPEITLITLRKAE